MAGSSVRGRGSEDTCSNFPTRGLSDEAIRTAQVEHKQTAFLFCWSSNSKCGACGLSCVKVFWKEAPSLVSTCIFSSLRWGAAAPQLAPLFTPLRSDPRHAPICLAHGAKALIEHFAVFWRGGNLFHPLPSQKKAAIASNFMQQSARRPRWTFELFTQGQITSVYLACLSLAESHTARKWINKWQIVQLLMNRSVPV